jgi:hypothetical protein
MFSKDRVVGGMVWSVVCLSVAAAGGGCQGRGYIIPPSDPDLRKTSAELAADSAKRQYPAGAPRGGELAAMADIDYGIYNRVEIMNLSDEDYNDVEIWMNEKYVFHASKWPAHTLKKVNFATLYDRDGQPFPMDNRKTRINKIEVLKDGKLFSVPSKLAE